MSTVYKTRRVTKYRTKRYKYCNHCGKRFSTTEIVDPPKIEKQDPGEDLYVIPDDE